MESDSRYFAIVPAAGYSRRMGQPKLLMPVAGRPLIAHTLAAWQRSCVDRILVVIRPDDQSLHDALQAEKADNLRIEIVSPTIAPPDMKASIQAALGHIETNFAPTSAAAFLVAPADMPRLSISIVNRLIERHCGLDQAAILIPTLAGKRGHPVLFPWSLASAVFALNSDEGLNAIVNRRSALPIACEDLVPAGESPFADIDTLDDYRNVADH